MGHRYSVSVTGKTLASCMEAIVARITRARVDGTLLAQPRLSSHADSRRMIRCEPVAESHSS
jgi:hypothetical protein